LQLTTHLSTPKG